MYFVEFGKSAVKDLIKIPKTLSILIIKKIKQLSANPFNKELNTKKLSGIKGYRLRIEDYRVLYEINKKKLIIHVIKIQSRGNVYD